MRRSRRSRRSASGLIRTGERSPARRSFEGRPTRRIRPAPRPRSGPISPPPRASPRRSTTCAHTRLARGTSSLQSSRRPTRTEAVKNPDAASALARAVNSWTADRWLTDPRLRGSIVVPGLYPQLAADEVDHWAGNPAFVQVLLSVRSFAPYGNRVWAAAARGHRSRGARAQPALRRRHRRPADLGRLAQHVPGGVRRHADRVSDADHEPGLRGRVLAASRSAGALQRERLCMDAEFPVALRPPVARAAARDPLGGGASVRLRAPARAADHPAVRCSAGRVRRGCSTTSAATRCCALPATTRTGSSTTRPTRSRRSRPARHRDAILAGNARRLYRPGR